MSTGATIDRQDIIIGCVAENTQKYLSQALRLLQSVRWVGGKIAAAKFIVCVVDGVDSTYSSEFKKYSAELRIVDRFSENHPPSNKLKFLQQPDLINYEHVLLLDCDTIVVQDPGAYLHGEGLRAKIADAPTVPSLLFKKLFDFFHLPLLGENYHCTVTGTPTIPYFNAGVLLFSQAAMRELVPEWIKLNKQLTKQMELLEKSSFFCEQASLSLALAATGMKFELFGNEMNFPIHFENHIASLDEVDPFIIHYHSCVDDDGFINASKYHLANARINAFNERCCKERGVAKIC